MNEYSGFQIEHTPTYYVADTGQLRPYKNHGLPGDELLCKFSDVKKLEDALAEIREVARLGKRGLAHQVFKIADAALTAK